MKTTALLVGAVAIAAAGFAATANTSRYLDHQPAALEIGDDDGEDWFSLDDPDDRRGLEVPRTAPRTTRSLKLRVPARFESDTRSGPGAPPPWAKPAGTRPKQHYGYVYQGHRFYATDGDFVYLPDRGVGRCNREVVGAVLGAEADAKAAVKPAGAVIGSLVGGVIGRAMDPTDQGCVGQVLERAPTGQTVEWARADQNGAYKVTPGQPVARTAGRYCRDFRMWANVGGQERKALGRACRRPDGGWQAAD